MEKTIQITAGRGPAECCWVVAQVLKFLLKEAKAANLEVQVMHKEAGELNRTLQSALLRLEGESSTIEGFLKQWIGTIQWVGQSTFRKHHKRKNWFIAVNVIDSKGEEQGFHARDLKVEAIRSGGPGGQHVNKVSTAVRATHIPTGISVLASDTRSQIQNKKKALTRLEAKVKALQLEKDVALAQDNWHNHMELERGNPVRTFHGSDFKSIKKKTKKNKNSRHEDRQAK